jgi:hypothetical protein
MTAYVHAFLAGHLSGPAEWLGWVGVVLIGVALGLALVRALMAAHDLTFRWPGDLDSDDMGGRK